MAIWHLVQDGDLPSTHQSMFYEKWSSKPVLAYTMYGNILVATLEHWGDNDKPEWFSNCSEHWSLDNTVTHWTELPEPPRSN